MRLNHLRYGLVALLTLFVIAACHQASPPQARLQPLSADSRILAFGDSLTWGNGAKRDQAYPAVLARLIGREVLNMASLTDETGAAAGKFATIVDSVQPALVLLCIGSYDFLHEVDPARTRANIETMIQMAQARHIGVVLLAVPNPRADGTSAPALFAELASQYNIPVDTTTIPHLVRDAETRFDPVHPNAQGYARLAEAVRDLLRREGALN